MVEIRLACKARHGGPIINKLWIVGPWRPGQILLMMASTVYTVHMVQGRQTKKKVEFEKRLASSQPSTTGRYEEKRTIFFSTRRMDTSSKKFVRKETIYSLTRHATSHTIRFVRELGKSRELDSSHHYWNVHF